MKHVTYRSNRRRHVPSYGVTETLEWLGYSALWGGVSLVAAIFGGWVWAIVVAIATMWPGVLLCAIIQGIAQAIAGVLSR